MGKNSRNPGNLRANFTGTHSIKTQKPDPQNGPRKDLIDIVLSPGNTSDYIISPLHRKAETDYLHRTAVSGKSYAPFIQSSLFKTVSVFTP